MLMDANVACPDVNGTKVIDPLLLQLFRAV
jgi:hypothetical protein